MKKNKKFDCVQMKWNIQERIHKEYEGLSEREAHKKQMEHIMKNPVLGPFLRRIRSTRKTLAK